MNLHNQISSELHLHWSGETYDLPPESDVLRSRLWNSINGFALGGDRTLYLDGADRHERPQEADDESDIEEDVLVKDLMSQDLSAEEIMRKMFGKKGPRPKALRREVERSGPAMTQQPTRDRDSDIPSFLSGMLRGEKDSYTSNRKEVLRPCPGLLSVSVQGELAYNRGLLVKDCEEYDRKYTEAEDIEHDKYPYNLGDLYMDAKLLVLMKEALLLLQPDGFYFSPTSLLCSDISEVNKDIEDQSNVAKEIFPPRCIEALNDRDEWEETVRNSSHCLSFAVKLCNDLQRTRKTARACFSVDDMRLIAKASSALRQNVLKRDIGENWRDLVWAVLYCRDLSRTVLKALKTADIANFLATQVVCKDGVLRYEALVTGAAKGEGVGEEKMGQSAIPLVGDGEFTGRQVVAAIALVFITYYWIDKRWITDVAAYDMTMPQSILMC